MNWLGLDIGGANLKAADGHGWAQSVPFPLWRRPEQLTERLAQRIDGSPLSQALAATMTGELCDCFETKPAGVRHIVDSLLAAAGNRQVRVYCVDGRFVGADEAREQPHLAAASNWHALASFVCRFISSRTGLLIDIGSTTTDIIPLVDSCVAARGRNDTERLLSQELLYRGVGRTPICALTDALPLRNQLCRIAAEFFATTADAHVLLGNLPEDPTADWTADGRPLTKACAKQRLARQLCADRADLTPEVLLNIADTVHGIQGDELTRAIEAVTTAMPQPPSRCILSGAGEFLARSVAAKVLGDAQILSLADLIGPHASSSAPAHAVAVLAAELGNSAPMGSPQGISLN
jgi:probable H4MPT-linked C1 transfer pathway protein